MSIALVIPNADFADNAIEQIVVSDPIPCTGITLNQSTGEITAIGDTLTLIPTVTPLDTTDTITWASSDDTVATVNNGVVTTTGIGTATITATCGDFSANCVITSRAFLAGVNLGGVNLAGNTLAAGGNGLAYLTAVQSRGTIIGDSGTLGLYRAYEGVMYYPIPMPNGTKRIKITSGDYPSITFDCVRYFDHLTAVSGYPAVAQQIKYIGVNDETVIDDNGTYTFPIPEIEGYTINSVVLSFRSYRSPDTWVDSDWDNITVEFLPAE